jgi:hypothetical protein
MAVAHDHIASNLPCGVEQHVCDSDHSDVSVASSSVSVSVPEDFIYTDTNDQSTVVPALPIQLPVRKKKKRSSRGSIGKRRHEH